MLSGWFALVEATVNLPLQLFLGVPGTGDASALAGAFGLMNLFARSLGGARNPCIELRVTVVCSLLHLPVNLISRTLGLSSLETYC